VIGVGLNVHNPLPPGGGAARLADYGCRTELTPLGERVARVVARATGSAAPFSEAELLAFSARDWLRGRSILGPKSGTAAGVSLNGKLRIALTGGDIVELEDSSGLEVGP